MKYGARPLRRAIQRYVEDEISDMILRSEVVDGQTINVDFKNDKLTFDVKNNTCLNAFAIFSNKKFSKNV